MPVHLTSEQIARIARDVASHLPEPWSYAEDPDWPGAIDGDGGLRIHLHQDYPGTGRVTGVIPEVPCGFLSELERHRGRLFVDLSLPASAIARRIERDLLDDYLAHYRQVERRLRRR